MGTQPCWNDCYDLARSALLWTLCDPSHARVHRRPKDSIRHCLAHPWVKGRHDDIVRVSLLVSDQRCNGFGSRQFHLFIDVSGSGVQGSAKESGESQYIVDLIGKVGSP